MGIKEDLELAKAERPDPVYVDVAIGSNLYKVEITRLDGMQWAGIMAECPPIDDGSALLGYAPHRAGLIACQRHGKLLDENGNGVEADWEAIFESISGTEVQAISATWWGMNMGDPNQRVVALKKASAGGSKTS